MTRNDSNGRSSAPVPARRRRTNPPPRDDSAAEKARRFSDILAKTRQRSVSVLQIGHESPRGSRGRSR